MKQLELDDLAKFLTEDRKKRIEEKNIHFIVIIISTSM